MRALALLLWLCAAPVAAEGLRLGTDGNFPPNVATVNGVLVGMEPELMALACPIAGYDCAWVVLPFDALEPALMAGEIDAIVSGLAATPARRARMAFTAAYLEPATSFYMTRSGRKLDLARATIAAQVGTTQAAHIAATPGATLMATETQDAALSAVRRGAADALLASRSWLEAQDLTGLDVAPGGGVQIGQGASIALRPDGAGQAARARLDAALSQLEADGRLQALRRAWFRPE